MLIKIIKKWKIITNQISKAGYSNNKEFVKKAFAALIDKIGGKGTWQSNPYVFVYDFKLIKQLKN